MGRSTPTTAFDEAIFILFRYNVDTLNICMKEFIIFFELRQLLPYMAFVYA